MVCSPNDESCDSFSKYYPQAAGTGQECGYVAFPSSGDQRLLSQGAIAGLTIGMITIIAVGLWSWHRYRFRKQRRRYKKRFVQQIARNISIGPSPREIPAEKLAEEIQHISSSQNGIINKEDLRKWMFDIKLNFLSDKDFDALWNAIDVDGRGVVEPLEFFVFLSLCGPEFETVYQEVSNMPKTERLKWATRRLTNYKLRGEQGVRKLEHNLERRSRLNIARKYGTGVVGSRPTSQYGSLIDDERLASEFSSSHTRSPNPSFRSIASSDCSIPNTSMSNTPHVNLAPLQQHLDTVLQEGSRLDEGNDDDAGNLKNDTQVSPLLDHDIGDDSDGDEEKGVDEKIVGSVNKAENIGS